jgi:hypothetical protein
MTGNQTTCEVWMVFILSEWLYSKKNWTLNIHLLSLKIKIAVFCYICRTARQLKPQNYAELIKVTGHPFWRFVENRYCALKISPIFIKFSPKLMLASACKI